ncbi:MAG: hypothetical protein HC872_07515 [Gammaproteobacteria bacterium]|nr:hypothetical protein [Gammaproteobacteria bacterium]
MSIQHWTRCPATLSKRILTGLLREEWGYDGVIVTDSMGMAAMDQNWGRGEAAVLSVLAGSDMIEALGGVQSQVATFEALEVAEASGRISSEHIAASLERLQSLARCFPIAPTVYEPSQREADVTLTRRAWGQGITKFGDAPLPTPGSRVTLVAAAEVPGEYVSEMGIGGAAVQRALEAVYTVTPILYFPQSPLEALDAVQSGTADIAHGTPYYAVGKAPVLHYFTGVPFGLTAPELAAWITHGEGMALWREVYDRFGVIPFYAGSSGVQAGGWFRKEINTLADLQGLRFRIAGLGGEVMKRLGVNTVLIPPGEISPSLLSGAIDAAEWIGPWNDRAFGLQKVAKFYYVPAFHEPGPGLEIIVNKQRWAELSPDLQAIVETAASAAAQDTYADFVYHNVEAFGPLLAEDGVELRTFSDEIIAALGKATLEVFEELATPTT